ncbi:hypothetical protein AWE51_18720 [Aquimarina aggregata]|uniref:PLAT domain-containing protein n=1 Tax=Aquimarina aggregata TaxID=1642818 RepID=A0A162WGC7_9FLAO|nr:hypothetical protein [Aquimarina aggregata]KZS38080.1 hypothetical protein AWE51_18720 [Aquimarina aggregata]
MKFKFTITLSLLLFIGCTKSDDSGIIIEPAGAAEYSITNQSDLDLEVVFTLNGQLNNQPDQSKIIKSKTSTIVFNDGAFGFNPFPSYTFNQIKFYETPKEENNLLLTISTVSDDDWTIIGREDFETGYGLTKFEFTITQESFE